MEERINKLFEELDTLLNTAPVEEDCTDKQNAMYSDMANLKESIYEYLEWNRSEQNGTERRLIV